MGEFLRCIELHINALLGVSDIFCYANNVTKINKIREQIYLQICMHNDASKRIKLVKDLEENKLTLVNLFSYLKNTYKT